MGGSCRRPTRRCRPLGERGLAPDDPVIPYQHGKRLFAAANEPKQFQRLRGGHIESTRDPAVQQRIVDFLEGNGCAAPAPQPPARDEVMDDMTPLPLPPAATGNNGYRF